MVVGSDAAFQGGVPEHKNGPGDLALGKVCGSVVPVVRHPVGYWTGPERSRACLPILSGVVRDDLGMVRDGVFSDEFWAVVEPILPSSKGSSETPVDRSSTGVGAMPRSLS